MNGQNNETNLWGMLAFSFYEKLLQMWASMYVIDSLKKLNKKHFSKLYDFGKISLKTLRFRDNSFGLTVWEHLKRLYRTSKYRLLKINLYIYIYALHNKHLSN